MLLRRLSKAWHVCWAEWGLAWDGLGDGGSRCFGRWDRAAGILKPACDDGYLDEEYRLRLMPGRTTIFESQPIRTKSAVETGFTPTMT